MSGNENAAANDGADTRKENCCKRFSNVIVHGLERGFSRIGGFIASNTIAVIVVSLAICLLFLIGLKDRYDENRGEELWIAHDSVALKNSKWFASHYPPEVRICSIIAEIDNVLTSSGLEALCTIDDGVKGITKNDSTTPNLNWANTCFSPTRDGRCSPITILQVWNNNCTKIRSLNDTQIISDLETFMQKSSRTSQTANMTHILGGITYDTNSPTKIIKAKVTKMTYILRNQNVFVKKEGRKVDKRGQAWEEAFVDYLKNTSFSGVDLLYTTETSRRTDSSETISGDLVLLIVSIVLGVIYLILMLGTLTRLNHKVWLAVCGVLCIGLSMGFSYGLSSACKLFVTPVHNILPFLLLGIGIDDVFVIIQNWQLFGGGLDKDLTIPDFMAKVMQHAGVSILVTSITDICAFLIGATTILPALRSFCIFAGIGIIAIFLLTCTFFVAWLSLDTKRKRSHRDACCCCIKLKPDWEPFACAEKGYLEMVMSKYSKVILSLSGRIFVLLVSAGLLAGGAYGLSQLRQDFDQDRFLPAGSMTLEYKAVDGEYFPEGVKPAVYVGKIDYFAEQGKLNTLYEKLNSNEYVVPSSVVSWYASLTGWLKMSKNISQPRNETEFYTYLNTYLNSKSGSRFQADVKFDTSKKIKASRIFFTHIKLDSAKQKVKAMDSIQDLAKSVEFTGFQAFGYTRFYPSWETNKIISEELIRNLVLAGAVILVITLLLLADIAVCLIVLLCIAMSLVNVSGYMHFWGLTVDVVTTIQLIIAVGLTVDYSAHIAHAFMASRKGSRVERAQDALVNIGPAVFHGGFSTFLAFVALAGSKSYVFISFFKVLFLVVVFGLFHGLVFLPTVLSLIGPPSYAVVEIAPRTPTVVADPEANNKEEVTSFDNPAIGSDD